MYEMARLSKQAAQAARQHPAQAAGNRFHTLGSALLALFDGLINSDDEEILEIVNPFRVTGVDHLRVDGDGLYTLMPGDHDRNRAAARLDFERFFIKRFLRLDHVSLHLLDLLHHACVAAAGHRRPAEPATTTTFRHQSVPP